MTNATLRWSPQKTEISLPLAIIKVPKSLAILAPPAMSDIAYMARHRTDSHVGLTLTSGPSNMTALTCTTGGLSQTIQRPALSSMPNRLFALSRDRADKRMCHHG